MLNVSVEPVARVDDLERGGRVRALALGLGLDAPLYTEAQLIAVASAERERVIDAVQHLDYGRWSKIDIRDCVDTFVNCVDVVGEIDKSAI